MSLALSKASVGQMQTRLPLDVIAAWAGDTHASDHPPRALPSGSRELFHSALLTVNDQASTARPAMKMTAPCRRCRSISALAADWRSRGRGIRSRPSQYLDWGRGRAARRRGVISKLPICSA